jgi:hypothetical protein
MCNERVTVEVGICTEHALVLAIPERETFHLAGAQVPRIKCLAHHAAEFTVNLKPFVPAHPDGYSKIKVPHAAIAEAN